MIFQLSARVIGKAVLKQPFEISMPPYTVRLVGKPGALCEMIVVQKKVAVTSDELPSLTPAQHGESAVFAFPDTPHFKDLEQLLQFIESTGSFEFSVRKIMWEQPEIEFIPECQEEESMLTISRFNVNVRQPTLPSFCEHESLALRLQDRAKLSFLTIPFAFFREGMIDYEYLRYASAFRSFYLCLEGLYGNGHTKNRKIEKELLNSHQLVQSVQDAIEVIKNNPKHLSKMRELLSCRSWPLDSEHVVKFLVATRGVASHFSNQSTLEHGHPLNHRNYFTVAYMAMVICLHVYPRCVEEGCVRASTKPGH